MTPTSRLGVVALLLLAACGGGETPPPADTAAAEPDVEVPAPPEAPAEVAAAPESVTVMTAQLTVVAYGPDDEPAAVELALADPLSRTTGVSAVGGRAYESIPDSRYELAGVQRDSGGVTAETAPLVSVNGPIAGTWMASVLAARDSRYRIDVRAVFDDGTGRRASAPWEEIDAGETRQWRITYDPGDAASFELVAVP